MAALMPGQCFGGDAAEEALQLDANRSAVAIEPDIFLGSATDSVRCVPSSVRNPNDSSNFFRFLLFVTPQTTLN